MRLRISLYESVKISMHATANLEALSAALTAI